ncbi:MAG: biotin--[acetyl-CoA-carboxylase] ligase [Candidatus Melainabacteria bacterium]|nr:biotin--[acetyl-CoA-carboxylase] ligase [Candidatus Melainabacteria bacterium]
MNVTMLQAFYYDTIDSTIDEAKRLIQAGKINDIAFIVANEQTKGRGTRGRKWESPYSAGIYLSIIHLPKDKNFLKRTTLYTQAAGIACVEAIKDVCSIQTQIKPINDIYFNGKKLGGILVESKLHEKGISSLITGIGINTHKIQRELDRKVVEPISLEEIMKDNFKNFSKEELIKKIVNEVCFWYSKLTTYI